MKRECIIMVQLPPLADEENRPRPSFFYCEGTPPFLNRGQLSNEYPDARKMTATTAGRWADIFSQEMREAVFTVYRDYGLETQAEVITYAGRAILI